VQHVVAVGTKTPWNENERDAVLRQLGSAISSKQLPGKQAIERCRVEEPVLLNRSWIMIKDYCRRLINKWYDDTSTEQSFCVFVLNE